MRKRSKILIGISLSPLILLALISIIFIVSGHDLLPGHYGLRWAVLTMLSVVGVITADEISQ